jgi:hypothetical protein
LIRLGPGVHWATVTVTVRAPNPAGSLIVPFLPGFTLMFSSSRVIPTACGLMGSFLDRPPGPRRRPLPQLAAGGGSGASDRFIPGPSGLTVSSGWLNGFIPGRLDGFIPGQLDRLDGFISTVECPDGFGRRPSSAAVGPGNLNQTGGQYLIAFIHLLDSRLEGILVMKIRDKS